MSLSLDELEATIIEVNEEKVIGIFTDSDIDDDVDICALMSRQDERSDNDVLEEWRKGMKLKEEKEGKIVVVVDDEGLAQYVRVKSDSHLGAVED